MEHELQERSRRIIGRTIHVKGLRGGHSGLEIDKGRGNSIKILNRVLIALEKVDARLSMIEEATKATRYPAKRSAGVYPEKEHQEGESDC